MKSSAKRAIESYQSDARFRAVAMSCVAEAQHEYGQIDPERADEEAYHLATRATITLLQRIYEEDSELSALKIERDHYKEIALRFAHTHPLPSLQISSASEIALKELRGDGSGSV